MFLLTARLVKLSRHFLKMEIVVKVDLTGSAFVGERLREL